jgi:hypothetical protein
MAEISLADAPGKRGLARASELPRAMLDVGYFPPNTPPDD